MNYSWKRDVPMINIVESVHLCISLFHHLFVLDVVFSEAVVLNSLCMNNR